MKKKVITVIMVILIIAGLGLAGFGIGLYITNKAELKSNTYTKERLEEKASQLLLSFAYSTNPLVELENFKVSEMDAKDKNILVSIAGNNVKLYEKVVEDEEIEEELGIDNIEGYIKKSDLFSKYEELYGRRLTEAPKELNISCPFGLYREVDEKYYMSYSCGGTGFRMETTSKYKIEENDKQAFYYFKYLFIAPEFDDEGQEIDDKHYMVYKDYYGNKNKKAVIDVDFEEVDDKYFEDAAKYVLIFDKKGGEYYFSELKKIEH